MSYEVSKTEREWRQLLSPLQYRVTRKQGTEPPFSGQYNDCDRTGTYGCVCCGQPLFPSRAKFHSGSGWPSFRAPVSPERIELAEDRSHGMIRTEVRCARCGAHLGHLFDDGPPPEGKRYCINSAALDLEPDD